MCSIESESLSLGAGLNIPRLCVLQQKKNGVFTIMIHNHV